MSEEGKNHAVPPVDKPRIEAAMREILAAIGEDPDRDGLKQTPARIARMYEEIFAGLREMPDHHLQVTFDASHDESSPAGVVVSVRSTAVSDLP